MMFKIINRKQSRLKTNHFDGDSKNKVIGAQSHLKRNCFNEKIKNRIN